MILTADSLAYYLIERGLISPAEAVDGELMILDATSRNRNFKVLRGPRRGYFVKQVQQWDPQSISFLQREASCYWRAAHDANFEALKALVPTYHLYDARRQILIVELLPEGENLAEHHRRLASFPLQPAARVGEQMGIYHRQVQLSTADGVAGFPKIVPWILMAHQLGASPGAGPTGANTQILSIIQGYPEFQTYLDALREQWSFDSFIHGDMKWENCIVVQQENTVEIKLIDWETADFGDACWDVGAIFQAYLTFWIMSIPLRGDAPLAAMPLARYPVEAMQPAIRAFWLAYGRARALSGAEQRVVLLRSVGYAAARMLQTAYEYMVASPSVTPNALLLLQVSMNMLTDTTGAAAELLSLA